jgi:type IV pilus assembly protein PilQ
MKANSRFAHVLTSLIACIILPATVVLAQESDKSPPKDEPKQELVQQESIVNTAADVKATAGEGAGNPAPAQEAVQETGGEKVSESGVTTEVSLSKSQNVTLDFKEADIQNVLKIVSYKSGVNIVSTPDVIGNVTIRLVDVPWETALDVILKTYGFGWQRQGNIILVTKMENISKIQAEEPLQTEIFTLKFLDAQDAQKILVPLLSIRGKISVLYSRGQKGWQFGTFKIGKETTSSQALAREQAGTARSETISIEKTPSGDTVSRKAEFEPSIKSKVLVITDTASSLDRIRNVILPLIDKKPKQVLIETRLMEVNRNKLKDLGLDWGTGASGASGYETAPGDIGLDSKNIKTIAGRSLASEFTPSIFTPNEGTTVFAGTNPYAAGLEVIFKKIAGTKFETILHALEEDVHTNTLSAPRILTLDNQEASILVGYHTPILASTVTAGSTSDGTGTTVTQTLDYYQEIGIRLNVVPQVNEDGYINMIIHPSVTSSSSSVSARSTAGNATTTTSYPVIDVREAQTQVMIKDGETIVIGGLLKDVKGKETIGIPFLSKIPLLGKLFNREIEDNEKVDLLIFITARIIKEGEFTAEEITRLQKGLSSIPEKEIKASKKTKQ